MASEDNDDTRKKRKVKSVDQDGQPERWDLPYLGGFFLKKNYSHFFLSGTVVGWVIRLHFPQARSLPYIDSSIISSEVVPEFWWQENKEKEEAERTRYRGKGWWNGWQGRDQQCL